ncbi:DNA replication protein [Bacillus luti]|uniref:DNA replication protein n=1 Tax=Bacillus luti TaxID=2026191 RepID=UPI003D003A34
MYKLIEMRKNDANQLRKRNEKVYYFIIDHCSGFIKSIIQKHLASFKEVQEEFEVVIKE